MGKKLLIGCGVPLILVVVIATVVGRSLLKAKPVTERSETVTRGDVEIKVVETGTIEALRKVEVKSKAGGLKYSLETPPPGMTVSADGTVTWDVPADFAQPDVEVSLTVRDASRNVHFEAAAVDLDRLTADALGSILGKQLPNDHFRLLVRALAEMMVARPPLGIDEIQCQPIIVVEAAPYGIVAVDSDRVARPQRLGGPANVIEIFLEFELRRVHADDH